MSYRTVFREAVGEIPSTSIDVDQVIRRQRRRRRSGRIGLAVAVGVSVLGVTVPLVAAGGPGPGVPASSPSPSPTAQPARSPRPAPGTTFSAADLAVFAALAPQAPDVEWTTPAGKPDGELATWDSASAGGPFFGTGRIRAGDRAADFLVQMERGWDLDPCTPEMIRKSACVDSRGPAGEKIQTWTNQNPVQQPPSRPGISLPPVTDEFSTRLNVLVERRDGIFLLVTVVADGEVPPVTLAQLTAVALDPAITLD